MTLVAVNKELQNFANLERKSILLYTLIRIIVLLHLSHQKWSTLPFIGIVVLRFSIKQWAIQ